VGRHEEEPEACPREQDSRIIQLPYFNNFKTIWEYKKSSISGRIDFSLTLVLPAPSVVILIVIGKLPLTGGMPLSCFPEFRKKLVPIVRFICRGRGVTFSLLPIQLIPHFQYTLTLYEIWVQNAIDWVSKGYLVIFKACGKNNRRYMLDIGVSQARLPPRIIS